MSDAPLHAVDAPDDESREELTGPRSAKTLRSRHLPLASPVVQLGLLAKVETEHHESLDFDAALAAAGWESLRPAPLEVFQINLGKLCKIQMVDDTEELSLEAASRQVYDPFPSDLTLKIPTAILESEGFDPRGPQIVEVRRRGLRDSFRSLEGRWVEPDLLAIMIADEEREGTPEPDSVAIGELPRRFARPSGPDVRAALREAMRPRETYRVRWRRAVPGETPPSPDKR